MSTSFQERAALQRRQVHHQQLLDSQRFDVASNGGARQSHPGDVSPAAGGGFFALIALVFVLILVLYAALATLLSVIAALPVALVLTTLARAMPPYHAEIGYARTYVAAIIGILSYLAVTLVIASCAGFISQPSSPPGFLNQLVGAIVELRHLAATSMSSFTTGEIAVAGFFGFAVERVYSIPVLVAALAALHGPGFLVCGAVLSKRIGQSYRGVRGFLIACAVSLAMVPASLVSVIWAAAILYERFHSI